MTGKRLKKLIMGRIHSRNFAEYMRTIKLVNERGNQMSNVEKYRMFTGRETERKEEWYE